MLLWFLLKPHGSLFIRNLHFGQIVNYPHSKMNNFLECFCISNNLIILKNIYSPLPIFILWIKIQDVNMSTDYISQLIAKRSSEDDDDDNDTHLDARDRRYFDNFIKIIILIKMIDFSIADGIRHLSNSHQIIVTKRESGACLHQVNCH